MILASVQLRRIGKLGQLSVDVGANESLLAHGLEQIPEFPFPALNQRDTNLDACVLWQLRTDRRSELGSAADGPATFGQWGVPAAGVEETR